MIFDGVAPIINYDRIRIKSDGDGIRTIVFFYDCPLRCKYCLNRHAWDGSKKPKRYSPKELLSEVEIDSLYFQATNGGITFGGGEPLLYPGFIKSFIEVAPKEWNYWVETSLAVPWKNIETLIPYITKFVIDIKSLDETIYQNYTGQSLGLAKDNLEKLIRLIDVKRIWIRVPYISGFMDKEQQMETVEKLKDMGIKDVEIFDYKKGNLLVMERERLKTDGGSGGN